MSAMEAVNLLGTELRSRPGSRAIPHAELPANANTGNRGGTMAALISRFLI